MRQHTVLCLLALITLVYSIPAPQQTNDGFAPTASEIAGSIGAAFASLLKASEASCNDSYTLCTSQSKSRSGILPFERVKLIRRFAAGDLSVHSCCPTGTVCLANATCANCEGRSKGPQGGSINELGFGLGARQDVRNASDAVGCCERCVGEGDKCGGWAYSRDGACECFKTTLTLTSRWTSFELTELGIAGSLSLTDDESCIDNDKSPQQNNVTVFTVGGGLCNGLVP